MEPVLELKNVSFTYLGKKEPAIRNINLKVFRGELVAIVGPLGSGKSTLLRTFNGLIPHFFPGKLQGEVLVGGLNTKKYEPIELARHVALILDDPRLQIFNLTVEDDVAFGPINLGLPYEEVVQNVQFAIRAARLSGLEKKHPKELSGGQQQRVAIAGVLALRPEIIAMDEPISMLDPIGKTEVLSAIRELNEKHNVTCIISESGSNLDDVISFVKRVLVMDRGRIIIDDTPKRILGSRLLEELGVGLPQVVDLTLKLRQILGNSLPIPLTVDEALEIIKELVRRGLISFRKDMSFDFTRKRHRGEKVVLEARNIFFTYPDGTQALRGVSLELRKGELIGLIGQNGSGKSTLALNLVSALKPTNKDAEIRIFVDGRVIDVIKSDPSGLITQINYIFQNPDVMLFSQTVEEEVSFALKMLGYAQNKINERVNEILKLLNLENLRNKSIIDLTLDQKTLVALASILVLKPRILIIDEPTSGLDRKSANKLMSILRNLTGIGHTIVIITHDMKLVYEYCDRTILMNDGQILLDGTPEEVFLRTDVLRSAYIKPPQITGLVSNLAKEYMISQALCVVDDFLRLLEVRGG